MGLTGCSMVILSKLSPYRERLGEAAGTMIRHHGRVLFFVGILLHQILMYEKVVNSNSFFSDTLHLTVLVGGEILRSQRPLELLQHPLGDGYETTLALRIMA